MIYLLGTTLWHRFARLYKTKTPADNRDTRQTYTLPLLILEKNFGLWNLLFDAFRARSNFAKRVRIPTIIAASTMCFLPLRLPCMSDFFFEEAPCMYVHVLLNTIYYYPTIWRRYLVMKVLKWWIGIDGKIFSNWVEVKHVATYTQYQSFTSYLFHLTYTYTYWYAYTYTHVEVCLISPWKLPITYSRMYIHWYEIHTLKMSKRKLNIG